MKLEHSDISEILETAIVAARLAGQRTMEEIKYTKASIKNNKEIVTNTDSVCQEIIIERIKENYPDHGFLAEEGTNGNLYKQPPRGDDDIWWIIDPIDGTNNFAHGCLSFGVSVAAYHDGKPLVGVIFDPATESMYSAARDMDAQLNNSRISISDEDVSKYSSFAIDAHFTKAQAQSIFDIMVRTRFRNLGSTALHFAYVAKGSFIGATTTRTKLWDIAAGLILVETAGGIVTNLQNQDIYPVDPANYTGQPYNILVSNKAAHNQLIDIFKGPQ